METNALIYPKGIGPMPTNAIYLYSAPWTAAVLIEGTWRGSAEEDMISMPSPGIAASGASATPPSIIRLGGVVSDGAA
jgi:hypothetical protein